MKYSVSDFVIIAKFCLRILSAFLIAFCIEFGKFGVNRQNEYHKNLKSPKLLLVFNSNNKVVNALLRSPRAI